MSAGPVLVYDGECGMCNGWVRRVLRHDRRRTLRFASLASGYTADLLARHPALHSVDSMLWVEPDASGERVLVRSDALLRTARYLGRGWRLAELIRLVPRRLRDAAYDLFARNRHRISQGTKSCAVAGPPVRARFLA